MISGTSRNAIIWFFLALFLVSIYLLGRLLMPFFSVLILAVVVSGIFRPVYDYLLRRARPGFASFGTCCLIFIVLFIPIAFFVGTLASEAYGLYQMGKSAVISNFMHLPLCAILRVFSNTRSGRSTDPWSCR